MKDQQHFEWTFSTRIRERECHKCRAKTGGYVTIQATGLRKALCSRCFFAALRNRAVLQLMNGGKTMKDAIYRQGDVLIRRIASLPAQTAHTRENGVLAYGEVTGHAHKVEDLTRAEVLEIDGGLFLRVGPEGVRIVHDEHAPIELIHGDYEVEIQREYTPQAIRNVAD